MLARATHSTGTAALGVGNGHSGFIMIQHPRMFRNSSAVYTTLLGYSFSLKKSTNARYKPLMNGTISQYICIYGSYLKFCSCHITLYHIYLPSSHIANVTNSTSIRHRYSFLGILVRNHGKIAEYHIGNVTSLTFFNFITKFAGLQCFVMFSRKMSSVYNFFVCHIVFVIVLCSVHLPSNPW